MCCTTCVWSTLVEHLDTCYCIIPLIRKHFCFSSGDLLQEGMKCAMLQQFMHAQVAWASHGPHSCHTFFEVLHKHGATLEEIEMF